jgi:hypothetical protein
MIYFDLFFYGVITILEKRIDIKLVLSFCSMYFFIMLLNKKIILQKKHNYWELDFIIYFDLLLMRLS